MHMSLDTQEKNEFIKKFENDIINNSANVVYLKALAALVRHSSKLNVNISEITEDMLEDDTKVRLLLSEFKESWAELASNQSTEEVRTYKTGQLAEFFGVSQTAINKWIREGRFVGIKRTKENMHINIPETTRYVNRGGKSFTVAEIVSKYNSEAEEEKALEDRDQGLEEFEFLVNQCARYEEKYGGELHRTLLNKAESELSPEERTDKAAWHYFSERLNDGRKDKD